MGPQSSVIPTVLAWVAILKREPPQAQPDLRGITLRVFWCAGVNANTLPVWIFKQDHGFHPSKLIDALVEDGRRLRRRNFLEDLTKECLTIKISAPRPGENIISGWEPVEGKPAGHTTGERSMINFEFVSKASKNRRIACSSAAHP